MRERREAFSSSLPLSFSLSLSLTLTLPLPPSLSFSEVVLDQVCFFFLVLQCCFPSFLNSVFTSHAGAFPSLASSSSSSAAVAAREEEEDAEEEAEEDGGVAATLRRRPTPEGPYNSAHRPSNARTILVTTSSKNTPARCLWTADRNSKLTEKDTQVVLAGRGPSANRQRHSRRRKSDEPEAEVRTWEGGVRVTREV